MYVYIYIYIYTHIHTHGYVRKKLRLAEDFCDKGFHSVDRYEGLRCRVTSGDHIASGFVRSELQCLVLGCKMMRHANQVKCYQCVIAADMMLLSTGSNRQRSRF